MGKCANCHRHSDCYDCKSRKARRGATGATGATGPGEPPRDPLCCGFRPGDLMVAGEFLLDNNNNLFVQHALNITALTVGRPSTDPNVRSWQFTSGPVPSPDCLGAIVAANITNASFPFGNPSPVLPRPPVIPRVRLTGVMPGPTPDCIIATGDIVLISTISGLPVDPAVAFGDETLQDFGVHLSIFAGGIDFFNAGPG